MSSPRDVEQADGILRRVARVALCVVATPVILALCLPVDGFRWAATRWARPSGNQSGHEQHGYGDGG